MPPRTRWRSATGFTATSTVRRSAARGSWPASWSTRSRCSCRASARRGRDGGDSGYDVRHLAIFRKGGRVLPRERQEPVDDGDGRVGQIVRLARAPQPAARPRLAWRPWLRWTLVWGPIWLLIGLALGLVWARHEFNAATEEILAPKNERIDHGV